MKEELTTLLIKSLNRLYTVDKRNIDMGCNERCICARLSLHMESLMREFEVKCYYEGYFADVEYNRMGENVQKRTKDSNSISCDLLIHSRGLRIPDNYLALEMKKKSNDQQVQEDKGRLKALTAIEENPTDYVCNTILGVFMTYSDHQVNLEFYSEGKCTETLSLTYNSTEKEFEIGPC